MSRSKGAAGEREFAKLLSAAMGIEVKRKLGAAREGGDDVEFRPFSFEVKRQESVHIEQWMEQAAENAAQSRLIPVVVFRRNGTRWRACMDLQDFFDLMKQASAIRRTQDHRGR